MSKNQVVDRSVGLVVTLVGTFVFLYTLSLINKQFRGKKGKSSSEKESEKSSEQVHKPAVPSTPVRKSTSNREHLVVHHGSCHCQRVQFKVLGPKVLQSVDLSSKLRFPRVNVFYEDFELLSHPSVLSMYSVQSNQHANIPGDHSMLLPGTSHLFLDQNDSNACNGIYSFCSYCGMHVIYAACLDPVEVQINIDCLHPDNIDQVQVMYQQVHDSMPSNQALDKRGIGYAPSPLYPLLYNRYQANNIYDATGFSNRQATPQHHQIVDPIDVTSEPFSDTTEDMFLRQQQQQQQRDMMFSAHSSHKSQNLTPQYMMKKPISPSQPQQVADEVEEVDSTDSPSLDSHLELHQGPSRYSYSSSSFSPNRNNSSYIRNQHHRHLASVNISSNGDQGIDFYQSLYAYTAGEDSQGVVEKNYEDWYSIPSPVREERHRISPQHQHSQSRHHQHHRHQHYSPHHRPTTPTSTSTSTPSSNSTSPLAASIPKVSHAFKQSQIGEHQDLSQQLPQFKKHLKRHLHGSSSSPLSSEKSASSSLKGSFKSSPPSFLMDNGL